MIRATLILALALVAGTSLAEVEDLRWELLKKMPHSRSDFTQGLEIRDGKLYQGTGKWTQSRLQVFDLETGRLLRERRLPDPYFGEGVTVLDERVIQLTWRLQRGLVFARKDLRPLGQFAIPGQGWGLTNDGQRLIYSDGSHLLRFISPQDWSIKGSQAVTLRGEPLPLLNELEWTPDGLYANVWKSEFIYRIDLDSGAVNGQIDLRGILPAEEREPETDVLNGVAYDRADNTFWVTGKNWPWLYQIRLCGSDCETAAKTQ